MASIGDLCILMRESNGIAKEEGKMRRIEFAMHQLQHGWRVCDEFYLGQSKETIHKILVAFRKGKDFCVTTRMLDSTNHCGFDGEKYCLGLKDDLLGLLGVEPIVTVGKLAFDEFEIRVTYP